MKHIFLISGGMAGRPVDKLNGHTCLEVAKTPHMDYLARKGSLGTLQTIPNNCIPSLDIAIFPLFGYKHPKKSCGRGPFLAKGAGVNLSNDDIAFVCSAVTVDTDNVVVDPSAGNIATQEVKVLLNELQNELGRNDTQFYPVEGNDHLMVIKKGAEGGGDFNFESKPPSRLVGQHLREHLPRGQGVDVIIKIMEKSKEVATHSDINNVRIDLKENPASMMWLWGQGQMPDIAPFKDLYGLEASIVTRNRSIAGFAEVAGFNKVCLNTKGEDLDEEYDYLAHVALRELSGKDLVMVYVDDARKESERGDLRGKLSSIEYFDKYLVSRSRKAFDHDQEICVTILPDTVTPLKTQMDSADPIPFLHTGGEAKIDDALCFSEKSARASGEHYANGESFMEFIVLSKESK